MSREFEKEYRRTNDRIHPRQDLLQEMEKEWAAEEAQQAAERRKVVAFPAWARFTVAAAGILLCIGVGMGAVLLYSRSRGLSHKTASAEAPIVETEETMEMYAPAEGAADAAVLQPGKAEGVKDAGVELRLLEQLLSAAEILFVQDHAPVDVVLRFVIAAAAPDRAAVAVFGQNGDAVLFETRFPILLRKVSHPTPFSVIVIIVVVIVIVVAAASAVAASAGTRRRGQITRRVFERERVAFQGDELIY